MRLASVYFSSTSPWQVLRDIKNMPKNFGKIQKHMQTALNVLSLVGMVFSSAIACYSFQYIINVKKSFEYIIGLTTFLASLFSFIRLVNYYFFSPS